MLCAGCNDGLAEVGAESGLAPSLLQCDELAEAAQQGVEIALGYQQALEVLAGQNVDWCARTMGSHVSLPERWTPRYGYGMVWMSQPSIMHSTSAAAVDARVLAMHSLASLHACLSCSTAELNSAVHCTGARVPWYQLHSAAAEAINQDSGAERWRQWCNSWWRRISCLP